MVLQKMALALKQQYEEINFQFVDPDRAVPQDT